MSALTAVTPALFPVVALPDVRDVASATALRYFEARRNADREESADAFDHLVAICCRAVRPYFLRDRHGSLIVENTPQFAGIDGSRTGHTRRKEGTAHATTQAWIQEWLLKFLSPYLCKSPEELTALADSGEFRYLGRLCRLRLKEIVRRQLKRESKDGCTGFISLEVPVLSDSGEGELVPRIATNSQDAPSSLGEISFEETLVAAEQARRIVLANTEELTNLDLFCGLMAYLNVAERVMECHFAGLVTRTIAGMRGVSERAARAYKETFHRRLGRELRCGNRAVRDIFAELQCESPRPFDVQTESDESRANKRLIRDARQLMAESAIRA